MKRFSAPVYPDPSKPPDDDDSESSLSDGSKKVKTIQSFESLFNNESSSDIVFDVNDGEFIFHAHKMIVGLKSERLAALIINSCATQDNSRSNKSSMTINKPVLYLHETPDCSLIFSRFLYFIYSGAVWLHRDYVVSLYRLSVKYGVGALATHCENYIIQLLNKSISLAAEANASPTLPVTTICDISEDEGYRDDTKKLAFRVLCAKFTDLIRTERWASCAWSTVRDLLRCDECNCEENLILVAATDWMKRNRLQDKTRIQDILSSIRYPRLPRRVLYHLYTTASFKNFQPVQDLIDAAIRYHCFKDVPEALEEFTGMQYRARGRGRFRFCTNDPLNNNNNNDNDNNYQQEISDTLNRDTNASNQNNNNINSTNNSPHRSRHHHHHHHHHRRECNNSERMSRSCVEQRYVGSTQHRSRSHDSEGGRNSLRRGFVFGSHRIGSTESPTSSFHPITSPVAAILPRLQTQSNDEELEFDNRDTNPEEFGESSQRLRQSTPDISLELNFHSHS